MQIIVLMAQNSVPADELGTATSTNNYFREAAGAASTIDPEPLSNLPDAVREGIVNAYADSLAPVFWYIIPFMVIALLLAFFIKQIPLTTASGLVARGEAIGGEEAERLAAEERAQAHAVRTD